MSIDVISPSRVELKQGETLYVEPGAMLAYKNCDVRTGLATRGIFDTASRFFFSGESLIHNEFTARSGGGWVALEEYMPGQIMKKTLSAGESPLLIRKSALVAVTPNVELSPRFLGLSGYVKGHGISMTAAEVRQGEGAVHFHTTDGVIRAFRIHSHEGPLVVDNNMIVAYSATLGTSVRTMGRGFSSLFSGEGLVTEFWGDGVVYVGGAAKEYKPPAVGENR